jgi:small subunit ribosomal protein S8
MIDPIADMLTRIRNSAAVNKTEVVMPMSKIKKGIAEILKNEGWILDYNVIKTNSEKNKNYQYDELKIVLKYKKSGKSAISNIKRISRPGLRVYVGKDELPKVLNNLGIAIISTSKGLMTNFQARKKGLGGEVICEIF